MPFLFLLISIIKAITIIVDIISMGRVELQKNTVDIVNLPKNGDVCVSSVMNTGETLKKLAMGKVYK